MHSRLAIALLASTATAASIFQPIVFQTTNGVNENDDLLSLHEKLVTIDSVSGNENDVGHFLQSELESRNFTVELQTIAPNRHNVYAYRGNVRETKVLLTSHMDTVPPFIAYSRQGDKIYGRGSVDAKASIAAQIQAFEELWKDNQIDEGDVSLLFVVDEEVHGSGMRYADHNLGYKEWDAVIFGEPTELKLGVGHKGMGIVTIKAHGKAAHSGYPELGVSANEILINTLHKILNSELPESDLLGPSTVNIGTIAGGVASNVVPAEAQASVAFRIAAEPEKIKQLLKDIAQNEPRIELTDLYFVDPQYLDYKVPGFDSIILAYSTDIPNVHGTFKRYLYGPGSIHVAHSADEHITVSDLHQSVEGYKQLVMYNLN